MIPKYREEQFKEAQEKRAQIIELYKSGLSCAKVGEVVGFSHANVRKILNEAGVKTNNTYKGCNHKKLDHTKIVSMYESGMTAPQIAKELGCGTTVIYRAVHDAGIKPSELAKTGKRKGSRTFDAATEKQIVKAYKNGDTSIALSNTYNVHPQTIRNIMKRHGIPLHGVGASWKDVPTKTKKKIISEYKKGQSIQAITQMVNLTRSNVSRILKEAGVKTRKRIAKGERHGHWKGGRITTKQGYIYILVQPDDPHYDMVNGSGYVMEHRLVMARHLKRSLTQHETVHHKDGNRQNNHIKNLQLMTGNHGSGAALCCVDCGSRNITPLAI